MFKGSFHAVLKMNQEFVFVCDSLCYFLTLESANAV